MSNPAGAGDTCREDFEQSLADDVRAREEAAWSEFDDIMDAKRDDFLDALEAE